MKAKDAIWNQVDGQVWRQVLNQVGDLEDVRQVLNHVDGQVMRQVTSQVRDTLKEYKHD